MSEGSAAPSFAADDLEVMSDAENYVGWIFSELVAPHLGRRVLEIGSGIGTYSSRIAFDPKVERLTSVEVEPRLVDAARSALATATVRKPVDHVVGDYLAAPLPKDHYDTARTALRYYNLTGFLGWLWRFRILGRTEQSRGLVRFFDRVVLPVQLRVERTLQLPVGQSVHAVAKKR